MTQADDIAPGTDTAIEDVAVEDAPSGSQIGEKLRAARERRGLSREQIADALHLDESVISALEQGRFDSLGAPVYVRGHLKAYGQLLGLAAEEFLGSYPDAEPKTVVAPVLRRRGVTPATVNPFLLAGGGLAVLLGLVLGAYVLIDADDPGMAGVEQGREHPAMTGTSPDHSPPTDEDGGNGMPLPEPRRSVAGPRDVARGTDADVPASPGTAGELDGTESSSAVTTARPVATMRLELQFNEESWVEISDANRRLLFGLQREGKRREITGEPPFNLLIGNASGVSMTVDGEPFDVPEARMRGKVARFEITGKESE